MWKYTLNVWKEYQQEQSMGRKNTLEEVFQHITHYHDVENGDVVIHIERMKDHGQAN